MIRWFYQRRTMKGPTVAALEIFQQTVAKGEAGDAMQSGYDALKLYTEQVAQQDPENVEITAFEFQGATVGGRMISKAYAHWGVGQMVVATVVEVEPGSHTA